MRCLPPGDSYRYLLYLGLIWQKFVSVSLKGKRISANTKPSVKREESESTYSVLKPQTIGCPIVMWACRVSNGQCGALGYSMVSVGVRICRVSCVRFMDHVGVSHQDAVSSSPMSRASMAIIHHPTIIRPPGVQGDPTFSHTLTQTIYSLT